MKFLVSWEIPQASYDAAVARFLEAGGAPLEGVTMLGRWRSMSRGRGVAIA